MFGKGFGYSIMMLSIYCLLFCVAGCVFGIRYDDPLLLFCSLYFASCWAMFYVLDIPSLNTPSGLWQPRLNDLDKNCPDLEEYVDQIIIPARDYFVLLQETTTFACSSYSLGACLSVLIPVHFIGKEVVNMQIATIEKILLCIALYVLPAVVAYFIYTRSDFCLRGHKYIESDCSFSYDYPLSYWHEKKKLHGDKTSCYNNNSLLFSHLRFIRTIYKPVRNRYYTAVAITAVTATAFLVMLGELI